MSFGDEDDELNCTLWVGNLDPKITESALFDIFVQGGPIEKIHIPKGKDGTGHKNYCFITFQHNESVPYTMHVLDGTILCGKVLNLQPRPGSKHKKLMDAAKENDQRQLIQAHQMQMCVPAQQHTAPPQWFIAPAPPTSQMAQYPNMLAVYPSQMYQAYSPCLPNMNSGMSPTLIPVQHGMTPHLIPVQPPLHHLPQETHQQHYQPRTPRPSADYRPRPPRSLANGYHSLPRHASNGGNAQCPSQQYSHSSQVVLNGSHSQPQRFQRPLRAPRPQAHAQRPHSQSQSANLRNCNNLNGNGRATLPQHRNTGPGPPFQTSPPLYNTNPVYRHSPPVGVGGAPLQYQPQPEMQFFHRPPFPQGDVYTY